MRILVFGGTGLIGSELLSAEGLRDQELIVVTRKPKGNNRHSHLVYCGYERSSLEQLFKGNYGIINLAGAGIGDKLWTKKRRDVILQSRLRVTRLIAGLVNEAAEKPVFILQASAVGYYGSRGDEILTEESGTGQGFLPDVTRKWEDALKLIQPGSTRIIFLRTGLVLSTKGGFLAPSMFLFRMFAGGHFGNGKQWMPWIHVADEIGAMLFLMQHQTASGAFNLVSPNAVAGRAFYNQLGKVLNRPSWLPVPAFILRLVPNGFGEELLLTSQHVKPVKLLDLGFSFQFPDLVPALFNLIKK